MVKLKLAVVGCGAVAEMYHLPAIALSDQVELTMVVDKSLARARKLADQYNVPMVVDDHHKIVGQVDAAILALPNFLHAPIALDLLQSGVHVLVEKPMALNRQQCDAMIDAAKQTGAALTVGFDLRFSDWARFVKQALKNKLLGNIINFDIRQGDILGWPVTSDDMFRKEAAGGGVLIDFGPHMLDLILWWFGSYEAIKFYDDAIGGVEANCELHLQMQSGASGFLELSWNRNLRNTCIIEGENGILEVGIWAFDPTIELTIKGQNIALQGELLPTSTSPKNWPDLFRCQLDNFAQAIQKQSAPLVSGEDGKLVMELIDACYTSRQLLPQPWVFPEMSMHNLLEDELHEIQSM